jgi:hypothetical protein
VHANGGQEREEIRMNGERTARCFDFDRVAAEKATCAQEEQLGTDRWPEQKGANR